jgi:hypothetical protein
LRNNVNLAHDSSESQLGSVLRCPHWLKRDDQIQQSIPAVTNLDKAEAATTIKITRRQLHNVMQAAAPSRLKCHFGLEKAFGGSADTEHSSP